MTMKTKIIRAIALATVPLLAMIWGSAAQAIPAWGKQYSKDCSSCHKAWPQLTREGRDFKENGYRLEDEIGEKIEHDSLPWSVNFVARPYDKKDSGEAKYRVLHEVEIFLGGAIGERWSGFLEIEWEDEIEDDFGSEINPVVLTWNYSQAFNLQGVWGEQFWSDPYGMLQDGLRMTRGHVATIDQKYGGADGRLRSRRQSLQATGRLANRRIFYSVGIAGDADDAEAVEGSNFIGRLAFDITDDIMIGGFVIDGKNDGTQREYSRYGFDAQADVGNSRFGLSYISAEDDVCGQADCSGSSGPLPSPITQADNDALSLQWFHTFTTESGRPTFVPLIRYDTYESSNGTAETDELTLNLTYYFRENVKAYLEYWDRDAPVATSDDDRLTLQIFVAF